ncbi:lysophospholipid acyltransferase family protein [Devriesea agamarum]|uniref:lysophospholipid acyltransferase family protein n=1 Tax=Devriesea agamarum TaxID=472569 RepID=UPI0008334A82|nr:lysophospholipid acyltransferase family protein [Devriesea agamarum]
MFYEAAKAIVAPLVHAIYRPTMTGQENIPSRGGVLLASNHASSVADTVFLPIMVRRKVRFLGKSDYFTGRGLRGRVVRYFMKGVGTLPVDRTGGRHSDAAIRSGLTVLGAGGALAIYPEGTRSPDGRLYRGKTGVARLALEARVPVIPVAMIGTFDAQPPGRLLPRRSPRVKVVIGEPLVFAQFYGTAHDRTVLRAVTDHIMMTIQELSGQEYVPEYASVAKRRLQAEAKKSAEAESGIADSDADAGSAS